MGDFPTKRTRNGVVVVSPRGRLNMAVAARLREQLHNLVQAGHVYLVVDLSRVDTLDSCGLGALISGLKAARERDGELCIAAPGEQALAVLEMTQLNGVFKSYPSADSAFIDELA